MILGIDASNIRAGGGVTHLVELLRAADPPAHGIDKVVVWAGSRTLSRIEEQGWLSKRHEPLLDKSLFHRVFWHRFRLRKRLQKANCDLLLVPGGSDASGFRPMIAMSQNLLPFEWRELRRFGWSATTVKWLLLRLVQSRTFRKADGVIFLSRYARDAVLRVVRNLHGQEAIVSHGVNRRFRIAPRPQRHPGAFTFRNPCRVLYVSAVEVYKHQWNVAEGVAQLRSKGVPIVLDLVGPPGSGTRRLKDALMRFDPDAAFIRHRGEADYDTLHTLYAEADVAVFASSCETFGLILTESMSAGLPIACSNRSGLSEILGDAGVYFDPESASEIAGAIGRLAESPVMRNEKAEAAFHRAQAFCWERCANETFAFAISTIRKCVT